LAARLIREGTADCGRYVDAREITEAIGSAARIAGTPGEVTLASTPRPKAWPAPNCAQIEAIGLHGPGLIGLQALSPVKFQTDHRHTEEIVDHLLHEEELVCSGYDKKNFETKTRAEWRGRLASMPFIVPSPMTTLTGITKAGKISARALANTGTRRYQVIEFDFAEKDKHGLDTGHAPMMRAIADRGATVLDLCASLLLHLGQYAPLVLVVCQVGPTAGLRDLYAIRCQHRRSRWLFLPGTTAARTSSSTSSWTGSVQGLGPAEFVVC
jgi:hypothetical protein